MSDFTVEYRGKAKRRDGESLPYQKRDRSKASSSRVTIFTVFNRDGKRSISFEPGIGEAIAKALGGDGDPKAFFFDLYEADAGAPAAARADW